MVESETEVQYLEEFNMLLKPEEEDIKSEVITHSQATPIYF